MKSSRFTTLRLDCLLILNLALFTPPGYAAETNLRDYLRACGIGDGAFAKFADDRQVAADELDAICRIAVRLRDCPADQLHRLAPLQKHSLSPADAKDRCDRLLQVDGELASVQPVESPGGEPLWRCTVTLADSLRPAVIYAADMPEKLRSGGSGQQVAAEAVFVKFVPGKMAERTPIFVSPRLQWRPPSPLADLGMDFGLLQDIHDNCPLTPDDHGAFYRLLELTRIADLGRPTDETKGQDDGLSDVAELYRHPATHRGRLVRLSGIARRVVAVPIDEPAIEARLGVDHYYEIDLVCDGSQNNPVVFCTLDLPDGMPSGGPPSYGQKVEVSGFFLKDWQYPTGLSDEEKATHPGAALAWQTAPLLIGPSPTWKPSAAKQKSSTDAAVSGLLVLVIIGVCLLLWHLRQTDQESFLLFSRRQQ